MVLLVGAGLYLNIRLHGQLALPQSTTGISGRRKPNEAGKLVPAGVAAVDDVRIADDDRRIP